MNKTLLVSAAIAGLMMSAVVHADDATTAPAGDAKSDAAHKCTGKDKNSCKNGSKKHAKKAAAAKDATAPSDATGK